MSLDAQKIPRKLVSVTGEIYNNDSYYLSSSVGEAFVSTVSRDGFTLTQGFQQPSLINIDPPRLPEFDEVRVYPNPVRDQLTIRFDVRQTRSYRIEVSSIDGKKLIIRDIKFDESVFWWEAFDFSEFSQGLYMIHIYSEDERINKVFKIEKISTRK